MRHACVVKAPDLLQNGVRLSIGPVASSSCEMTSVQHAD